MGPRTRRGPVSLDGPAYELERGWFYGPDGGSHTFRMQGSIVVTDSGTIPSLGEYEDRTAVFYSSDLWKAIYTERWIMEPICPPTEANPDPVCSPYRLARDLVIYDPDGTEYLMGHMGYGRFLVGRVYDVRGNLIAAVDYEDVNTVYSGSVALDVWGPALIRLESDRSVRFGYQDGLLRDVWVEEDNDGVIDSDELHVRYTYTSSPIGYEDTHDEWVQGVPIYGLLKVEKGFGSSLKTLYQYTYALYAAGGADVGPIHLGFGPGSYYLETAINPYAVDRPAGNTQTWQYGIGMSYRNRYTGDPTALVYWVPGTRVEEMTLDASRRWTYQYRPPIWGGATERNYTLSELTGDVTTSAASSHDLLFTGIERDPDGGYRVSNHALWVGNGTGGFDRRYFGIDLGQAEYRPPLREGIDDQVTVVEKVWDYGGLVLHLKEEVETSYLGDVQTLTDYQHTYPSHVGTGTPLAQTILRTRSYNYDQYNHPGQVDTWSNLNQNNGEDYFTERVLTWWTYPEANLLGERVATSHLYINDRLQHAEEVVNSYHAATGELYTRHQNGLLKETRLYDTFGNLVDQRDALGVGESYSNHRYGIPRTITYGEDPQGQPWTRSREIDLLGRVLSETNGRGYTTTYEYDDPLGRLTLVTPPALEPTIYTYDPVGMSYVERSTGPAWTRWTYDGLGRLAAVTDHLGGETEHAYSPGGVRVLETQRRGGDRLVDRYFDLWGRLTREEGETLRKRADGTDEIYPVTRTFTYAWDGLEDEFEDEELCNVTRRYQPTGDPENRRLLAEDNCQHEQWSYQYDDRWDEVVFKDGPGLAGDITLEYDDWGRLKRTFTYAKGNRRFAWQDNDLLAATWDDRPGSLLFYGYDPGNRLKEVWSGGTLLREYRYDANGNLEQARSRQHHVADYMVTDHTYTPADLPDTVTWKPSEAGTASYTTDYNYVPQKTLVESLTYPTSMAFTFRYDTRDQLEQVRLSGVAQPLIEHIGYTAWGGVERIERRNGIDTDYDYGPGLRLRHLGDVTGVQAIEHLYDARGNLTALLDRRDWYGGQSRANHEFEYTDLGQLAREEVYRLDGGQRQGVYEQEIDYDALHNRLLSRGTSEYVETGPATYEYVYLNNRLRRVDVKDATTGAFIGDIRYLYDLSGNMVERRELGASSGEPMLRDALHQLVRYGGVEYEYDHAGRRVIKRDGNRTTYYFYQGDTLLSEIELEGSVVSRKSYAFGPAGRLVEWRWDATTNDTAVWYPLTDHHGSTQVVLDETGAVLSEVELDGFGKPIPALSVADEYLYTGKQQDEESGLFYFGARYYDPEVGRFDAPDPIPSKNQYVYALNSPHVYEDPDGMLAVRTAPPINVEDNFLPPPEFPGLRGGEPVVMEAAAGPALINAVVRVGRLVVSAAYRAYRAYGAWRLSRRIKELSNKAGSKCFVGGTLVLTSQGYEFIENIEPGDIVLTMPEGGGEPTHGEVAQVFRMKEQPVLSLEISFEGRQDELLGVTAEHPFWVESRGWTPAGSLQEGDELVAADGDVGVVRQLSWIHELHTVYNLEITEHHTYFVGISGIWVHNTCADEWHPGSHDTATESLEAHFARHGKELGSRDVTQYYTQATEFARTIRGARRVGEVRGATEGVMRYEKNGKYIDIAPDRRIVSFGKR